MKTFLIFRKNETGYESHASGSYEALEKDETSGVRSHLDSDPLASHFELPSGMDKDVVKLVYIEEQTIGDEVIAAHHEVQVDAALLAAKVARAKEAQVIALYNEMNVDVLTRMSYVFGTTNTDSAAATERTWSLMVQKPEKFSGVGLKASFEAGGILPGEALDTNAKVVAYAQAKADEVEDYGVWRMKRIQDFTLAKQAILDA